MNGLTLNGPGGTGLNSVTSYPLFINSVSNSLFENLDVSWTGAGQSCFAFVVAYGASNNTFQNITVSNRSAGFDIASGSSNNIVQSSLIQNNGVGVGIANADCINNSIRGNSIYGNTVLGI